LNLLFGYQNIARLFQRLNILAQPCRKNFILVDRHAVKWLCIPLAFNFTTIVRPSLYRILHTVLVIASVAKESTANKECAMKNE